MVLHPKPLEPAMTNSNPTKRLVSGFQAHAIELLASACLTSYHSRTPGWVEQLAAHGTL